MFKELTPKFDSVSFTLKSLKSLMLGSETQSRSANNALKHRQRIVYGLVSELRVTTDDEDDDGLCV